MRRAELAVLAVALGGCMKIYQDTELPDVVVAWEPDACQSGGATVVLVLAGIDRPTRVEESAPCDAREHTFADVARERFTVEATLRAADGTPINAAEGEVDLRNGIGRRLDLYFSGRTNYRVAWELDMDATCQALGAIAMQIQFARMAQPGFSQLAFCDDLMHFGFAPTGVYDVQLHARSPSAIVAASERLTGVALDEDTFTDLGVVTLVPCSATTCP